MIIFLVYGYKNERKKTYPKKGRSFYITVFIYKELEIVNKAKSTTEDVLVDSVFLITI